MSEPAGWNSVLAMSSPWTSALRTKVLVTTSATPLPTTPLDNRKGLYVFNPGTVIVYLAPSSDVNTTNEDQLFPKQGKFLPASDAVTIYGIVATGSVTLTVWEYAT